MSRKNNSNEIQAIIDDLTNCPTGQKASTVYEELCCRTLHCLFPREFFIFSPQHPTHDMVYRMDLQVSLNGKTKFWRSLKSDYQSRYVVFEFKNYAKVLPAKMVDLTTKYFCKDANRNVIFLISRKGLSVNARTAAMKHIRNGQLMIELTDADLIEMLRMKQAHQDPSLHLQRKVDALLMGFSA